MSGDRATPMMAAPGPETHGGPSPPSPFLGVNNMDWLLKKEKIFLLAQFWQQVIYPTMFRTTSHNTYDPQP